jgi:predicted transposase YdaD
MTVEGSEIMQTLAERWVEEGREQGIEQGIERATRLNTLDLLTVRFGEPPALLQERLAEIHDIRTLRRLLIAAATAGSLAEFEAALP